MRILIAAITAIAALMVSAWTSLPGASAPATELIPAGLADAGKGADAASGLPLEVVARDGAPMVLVSAGTFEMGSRDGRADEAPIRRLHLGPYYIDKLEVTVGQFRRFLEETGFQVPDWILQGNDDTPVAGCTFYEAAAYARWVGKTLPTEAQWEKAARGPKGTLYPWGQTAPNEDGKARANCVESAGEGTGGPRPVGAFPDGASPYGCLDLAGNVWEWCADWYRWGAYRDGGLSGPAFGTARVIRGGSHNNLPYDVRASARGWMEPYARGGNIGFRCVVNVGRPQGGADEILQIGAAAIANGFRCEAEDAALRLLDIDPDNTQARSLLARASKLHPPGYTVSGGTPTDEATGLTLEIVSRIDGTHLRFVSAGEFAMGAEDGFDDERPEHVVVLDSYYIDVTPVTNKSWDQFTNETGHGATPYSETPPYSGEDLPVVGVTYRDATSYARWCGRRVPTEAQWEKAARGATMSRYPWGDEPPEAGGVYRANYAQEGKDGDGYAWTSPVGAFPAGASPYGCLDLAGNVWEWCADWYDATYYRHAPTRNPQGPDIGSYRVLRGGAFHTGALFIRATARFYSRDDYAYGFTGMRLAAPAQ